MTQRKGGKWVEPQVKKLRYGTPHPSIKWHTLLHDRDVF